MKISKSKLEIPGAPLLPENPLPLFRARERDQHFASNGTLSDAELAGFGRHTGFRLLPYGMQDRYTIERSLRQYETIVLENDKLRAEFLPQYGGRLYSLYSKELKRELLFKNPVFQPANLAIRNAWFSGGIEWNVGQLGHAFHTCDDVYFARCRADGEEFLRMCEVWFRHQALKAAAGQANVDLDALTHQLKQTLTPPRTIDYRLAQA